ncbi:Uu.00g059550.m01.CDS01 [Anthostomella pinea]|uniref:Uu.00g059550.m01.CDS01 n=1 Tax=Anthostomella pinea TaxID=933095 RepID=A0AAI8YMH6_9PEZI|nr:Uu.00g059550.m01.CDS01 [Anthostomella pinea]
MDDPWYWDVDRVVQELCSANRSWASPSAPLRLPPTEQLEAALRNHEVDGEVLLTYDQAELCAELGIKILKHKSTFKNAIQNIRLRSKQYRLDQKRQASELNSDNEADGVNESNEPHVDKGKERLENGLASVASSSAPITNHGVITDHTPGVAAGVDKAGHPNRAKKLQSQLTSLETMASSANHQPDATIPDATDPDATGPDATGPDATGPDATENDVSTTATQEPAPKKRRLAPSLILAEVNTEINRNIQTEADVLTKFSHVGARVDTDGFGAYLGSKAFTRFDIMDAGTPDEQRQFTTDDREINFVGRASLIPGRLIQTHRVMKRRLLNRRGYQPARPHKADAIPGANNPDNDKVLPLYGESDDDEEYDSATWREIEAEKQQKAISDGRAKGLTADEVNAVLDEAIARYASNWKEHKLPKLVRKANRLWNDARRYGLRAAITKAQKDLRGLEDRLAKYRENFLSKGEWRNAAELERTTGVLEATVEYKEHSSWLLGVLGSPREPAKPQRLPRTANTRPRAPRSMSGDEEETLTSESGGDIDDFITDDEVQPNGQGDEDLLMDTVEDGLMDTVEDGLMDTIEDVPRNGTAGGCLPTKTPDETDPPAATEELAVSGGHEDDHPMDIETPSPTRDILAADTAAEEPAINGVHDDDHPMAPENTTLTRGLSAAKATAEDHPIIGAHTNGHAGTTSSTRAVPVAEAAASHPKTPSKPRSHVIDLTTPRGQASTPRTQPHSKGKEQHFAPRPRSTRDQVDQSPLIMTISDVEPREQRIATELAKMDAPYYSLIFKLATTRPWTEIWLDLILPALDCGGFPKAPYDSNEKKDDLVAYTIIRMFEMYKDDTLYRPGRYKSLNDEQRQRLRAFRDDDLAPVWEGLINFLARLSDRFEWSSGTLGSKKGSGSKREKRARSEKQATPLVVTPQKKKKGKAAAKRADSAAQSDTDSDAYEEPSSKKPKHKTPVRNREAANLRESDQVRLAEQAHRRQILRERLQAQGEMGIGSQSRLIINESKTDEQGFVYVHNEIARQIKDHQVTGVRFMWNQIVDAKTRQGCLLAHTMGLGKTMQIITLLVAISQAAESDDPSISSQIPKDLKVSKTLVLCPPGLVNNWLDELLRWSPEEHTLGEFYKIEQMLSIRAREEAIQSWSERGGVLIIGYNLFKSVIDDEDMHEVFMDGPNIVVADEAHLLKNPKSKVHIATANFRTQSRLALTGSPLANNVEEYYAMINWVAPHYLSDLREFRQMYANPIKEGLGVDSTPYQRRQALKILHVLKSEVAPKISRITISVLKKDIPIKKEFVIMVPLAELQRKAYDIYIRHYREKTSKLAVAFAAVNDLGLICAHPFVLLNKMRDLKNPDRTSKDENDRATMTPALISEEMPLLANAETDMNIDEFSLSWKVPLLIDILESCKKLGDSILLFSHSIYCLDYLERILRKKKCTIERLDGTTKMEMRQDMVKQFNKGKADLFLISTTAGSLGLNITGANRVIIFDSKFNPQLEQQAVGRSYRIGQTKPVFVYRFICGGTYEEKMLNQAIWKMQLASRVVDEKNPIPKAQKFTEGFGFATDPVQKDLEEHRGKDSVLDKVLDRQAKGISSITMWDTFEEEALEDAVLPEEDAKEAAQILAENEARRSGKPLPPRPAFLTIGRTNGAPELLISTSLDLTGPDNGAAAIGALAFANDTQAAQPVSASAAQTTDSSATYTRDAAAAPVFNSLSALAPVQHDADPASASYHPMPPIPGASTHFGAPEDKNGRNWESKAAFKGELSRSFAANAAPHEQEHRREIANEITALLWARTEQQDAQQQGVTKWAVMNAASSPRFVEAVCMGAILPQHLAQMDPPDITQRYHSWEQMEDADWELQKASWSQESRGDPEHLHVALRKMSFTTRRNDLSYEQPRSHRIDDKQALEAVLERRKSKQSSHGKEARLPDWARSAVAKQGRIAPMPSPPAASTTSPSIPSRPQAKTPFK